MGHPLRVLMVCTGNICRSPTAEAVLRSQAQAAGLGGRIEVDSAGTHGYHVGEAPDARAQAHALGRGLDLSTLRARRLTVADFRVFDWILAMDAGHLQAMRKLAPPDALARLDMLLRSEPGQSAHDVPDPYYGAAADFERVLDCAETGCRQWLNRWFPSR
jgi:protein-tyrosine phosphatase